MASYFMAPSEANNVATLWNLSRGLCLFCLCFLCRGKPRRSTARSVRRWKLTARGSGAMISGLLLTPNPLGSPSSPTMSVNSNEFPASSSRIGLDAILERSNSVNDSTQSGYNMGTIRADIRYLVVSKDVRRHRLISISYINQWRCHGRGRSIGDAGLSYNRRTPGTALTLSTEFRMRYPPPHRAGLAVSKRFRSSFRTIGATRVRRSSMDRNIF
jgi:hypothetical protein